MDPITRKLVETVRQITENTGLGAPGPVQTTPNPSKRGVTKDGKIITINDPGYKPSNNAITGAGRRNQWRDAQGNVHVTYGVNNTPPSSGMKLGGGDYVEIGDDYKEGDSLQDYYKNKTEQRQTALQNMMSTRNIDDTLTPPSTPTPKPEVYKSQFQKDQERMAKSAAGPADVAEADWFKRNQGSEVSETELERLYRIRNSRLIG